MSTKQNLTMDQGSEFLNNFSVSNANGAVDLSTYTAASQMRKHYSSNTAINISVSLNANGVVQMYLPSTNTAVIEPGRYEYDVEITDSSAKTYRILEGIMTVTPGITR